MYIVAIAWIYVVLMMAITEYSVAAGIMTFLMYCVLPLTMILYLMRSPQRKRANKEAAIERATKAQRSTSETSKPDIAA
ncbi:MAG: hypothetical protein HYZ65_14135 [Burkholderiales bacterium]|nr:hypothetical protein [Burkholderiales bacterium]